MKKMVNKLQGFGQKMAQLRAVVDRAPEKAAQLREAVLMTADQLQQMRAEVQSTISGLRVDRSENFAQLLNEIGESADTVRRAGYELLGMDMDMGAGGPRLSVRLRKVEDVSDATLRSLLAEHARRPALTSLLNALRKADEVAEQVSLTELEYRDVVVYMGATPSLRVCWRPVALAEDEVEEEVEESGATRVAAAVPPAPQVPAPAASVLGPRLRPAATVHAPATATEPAAAAADTPVAPRPAAAPRDPVTAAKGLGGPGWQSGALERFKKMPTVSKYAAGSSRPDRP